MLVHIKVKRWRKKPDIYKTVTPEYMLQQNKKVLIEKQ